MRNLYSLALTLFVFSNLILVAKSEDKSPKKTEKQEVKVNIKKAKSPNGKVEISFNLTEDGTPQYSVKLADKEIIAPSNLGFKLKGTPNLLNGFALQSSEINSVASIWEPVWGEDSEVKEYYNELEITLKEKEGFKRKLKLQFRVFDDGVGFRYVFPKQKNLKEFIITDELTQFKLTADHKTWWIPNNYDTYEMLYVESPFTEIGKAKHPLQSKHHTHQSAQKNMNGANTPLTMKTNDGVYLSLHEAALLDYAGMTLIPKDGLILESDLVPWPDGDKVLVKTPSSTPWRTIQITNSAGGLIESKLVLKLNEPSKITDTSYIEPMKYIGIWWSMHLGITTWGKDDGRHGATTEEAFRYIDFAAKNNIKGVLVEGWNTGWESWYKDDNFDFYTPYKDFNLHQVVYHANKNNIEIIGHHETGGQVESYEENLKRAFKLYKKLGIKAVKTGYAGKIRPDGYFHHSQWMVRHYTKVMEEAAKSGIMLIVHEPIKPTGLRRTYPNLVSAEGVRGMEWNAWSQGNPPEHTMTIPFTRMLAGPLDYTPGVFDLKYDRFAKEYRFWNGIDGLNTKGKMSTTLAKQLALYVILYSPVQMASDLIENYDGHPAFEFIRKVPVDWDKTKVLNGEIGEFVMIVRKEKGKNNWFLGAATDEKAREWDVDLNFLEKDKLYTATIYKDSFYSHYKDNPTEFVVDRKMVTAKDKLAIKLAPGGGYAASFEEVRNKYFD